MGEGTRYLEGLHGIDKVKQVDRDGERVKV